MSIKLTEAESRFIERLGQQAQNDGITRIAGQIWAALIISDAPLSSSDLSDMLQISKGSISTNTRTLEMLNIIERRSVRGERQDYFSMRSHPYAALVEGQIKRFNDSEEIVAEARNHIEGTAARAKLADLAMFYELYRKSSEDLLQALKSRASEPAK